MLHSVLKLSYGDGMQLHKYIKILQIVQLKWVNLMVYKLYIIKAGFFLKAGGASALLSF